MIPPPSYYQLNHIIIIQYTESPLVDTTFNSGIATA